MNPDGNGYTELKNDIAIRCKKCKQIIYLPGEIYGAEEETVHDSYDEEHDPEIYSVIRDELICKNCGNEISFYLEAVVERRDIYNNEPVINGGVFIEDPVIGFIEDDESICSEAYDNADDVQKMILDIARHRDAMYDLNPRQFEMVVERLFQGKGFRTQLTPQTRDGGKDIIATKYIGTGVPFKIYVECKKFSPTHTVGIDIVRAFCGVLTNVRIDRGYLVTTSCFSPDVWRYTKRNRQMIELIDGDAVFKMIRINADKYYDRYYGTSNLK